jgi:hypothetical protein
MMMDDKTDSREVNLEEEEVTFLRLFFIYFRQNSYILTIFSTSLYVF